MNSSTGQWCRKASGIAGTYRSAAVPGRQRCGFFVPTGLLAVAGALSAVLVLTDLRAGCFMRAIAKGLDREGVANERTGETDDGVSNRLYALTHARILGEHGQRSQMGDDSAWDPSDDSIPHKFEHMPPMMIARSLGNLVSSGHRPVVWCERTRVRFCLLTRLLLVVAEATSDRSTCMCGHRGSKAA